MDLWTPDEKLNYAYAFMKYHNESLTLDFWQDDFIKSRSRYICLLKSRQTGFSFAVALKGLIKAMDPARLDYTKQFVSYNIEDAQEKIRYALEFYESIPARYKKKLVHKTETMLEFQDYKSKTTSRLISLPCRPPRGKNGDVCLDEFAIYLPRLSKEIYTAASFCTLRRGCIEVGSTPLGTIGKFYEICTDKENYPDFDRYFIPWWYAAFMCTDVPKAVREAKDLPTEERVLRFGTEKLIKLFRNSSLEDFQQECECTFIDSAASYISLELIYSNTPGRRAGDIPANTVSDEEYFSLKDYVEIKPFHDADELILHYNPDVHGSPLFMGMDVGRHKDATAFYIFGILDGKKRALFRLEMRDKSFDEQKDLFRRLMRSLPIFRACIDKTGMGMQLSEDMQREFGERVEGMRFSAQSKEMLAMNVKTALERQEFLLENERDFHAQIHAIKRTPTSGGSFRYDAERNEKGHADSFWAWALANYAATDTSALYPRFYNEYDSKKSDLALQSAQGNEELLNASASRLTARSGKSLESVLRRVRRVHETTE
ncbi:MAG: hypothetical protein ACTTKL_07920 [Treponema sp.]